MKMKMKMLMVTFGFLASSYVVHAESCTPNYQVQREDCNDDRSSVTTTKPVSSGPIEVAKQKRERRTGADLAQAYCLGDRIQRQADSWGVSPEDIQVYADNEDTREPWAEGNPIPTTFGSYRRVTCTYKSANAPVYKKVSGPNCAVVSAKDSNNCFAADRVSVDSSIVQDCIYARPGQDEAKAWKKTQCLVDAYRAAKEQRVILPFNDLRNAMEAYATSAPTEHLRAYLRAELQAN